MDSQAHIQFVGQGWSFPPRFTKGGKELEMVSEIEDIKESLEILFGTSLGERIMQESYGSSLVDYQFEEMSLPIFNRLRNMIMDAVLTYESRIELQEVEIFPDPNLDGMIHIHLDFVVFVSNTRFNMVYPFYLKEATV